MIKVESLYKSFGEHLVLRNVSFSFKKGEKIALIGPSDSGKSVLLKVLAGIIKMDQGELSYSNGDTLPKIGFLFQEGALFDSLSVIENVCFPVFASESSSDFNREEVYSKAYDLLKEVGLSSAINKMPGELSGGMQRRVALARAVMGEPDLLLLDDPTAGLDPVAANVILDLIDDLHEKYKPAVIIVSHDLRRLIPRAERVLALFSGKLVGDASNKNFVDVFRDEVLGFIKTRYDL